MLALETTSLNISEIAYAGGFTDPTYFTRVFKQHKGMTPHEYRAQMDADRNRVESQPKTVYFDRLDFSHGRPKQDTGGRKSPVTLGEAAPVP